MAYGRSFIILVRMDTPLAKAEEGYTDAQYLVGLASLTDETPDLAKAQYWLSLSAGKGHPLANELLAYGLAHGILGAPSGDEFQAIKDTHTQDASHEMSEAGVPAAERLRRYIEWLSQDCWFAGWYDGIEFDLWTAIPGGQFRYGGRLIAAIELRVLQWLSETSRGWIMWDDSTEGPVFVDLEAWKAIYEQGRPHRP